MKKRAILVFALIIVLTTVGLVAAEEAGIFTINIFNSPNSQIHTDISNSTIEGQTNYTNSQAVENITLTNSTLTININGENLTITEQDGNMTIDRPNQTPAPSPSSNPTPTSTHTPTATATSAPTSTVTITPTSGIVSVTFISSGPNRSPVGNGTQYDFNVTVGIPTSLNYPFGKNITHDILGQALMPLATKYNLTTRNTGNVTTGAWQNMVVVAGENTFSLWSTIPLTLDQRQNLTTDLQNMFTSIV
jgi:hypothetical protein